MPSSAVVVGAGVLGSSVADRLARSGWAVTHVEQLAPVPRALGQRRRVAADPVLPRRRRAARAHGAPVAGAVAGSSTRGWSRRPVSRGWPATEDGWEAESERVAHPARDPNLRVDPTDLFTERPDRRPRVHAVRARGRDPARARGRARAGRSRWWRRAPSASWRSRGPTASASRSMTGACSMPTSWSWCVRRVDARAVRPTCCACASPQQDVFYFAAEGRLGRRPSVCPLGRLRRLPPTGSAISDGRGVKVAPRRRRAAVRRADRRAPACTPSTSASRGQVPRPIASRRWPARRWSARACASTRSRPTPGSSPRRTPSTTAASGSWAAAPGTPSSTAGAGRARRELDHGRAVTRAALRPGRSRARHVAAHGRRAVVPPIAACRRSGRWWPMLQKS